MGLGGLSNTVAFGIKAVADLRGIDQTSKALTGLAQKGTTAGTGIARGMSGVSAGLTRIAGQADLAAHSLRGIAAASAGVVALGVGLFKVGEGFEKALDTIRVGTGATGKALDALGEDARAVFRELPTSLQTAAEAITEVNRRTGDTGKGLQELAAAEIELAHITGTDLNENIATTSKLFQQWGVSVEDQVTTLDKLFRASQSTGVSVGTLAGEVVQFGPILRTMGFGLDQSIALLATLDKAGVNTGQVITGLRTAIAKFSSQGVTDLGAALADVFAQIKNAPTDVAAATIAIDTFGVRAGPALADNIRSGRLGYTDLIDVVANGTETIHKADLATQHFSEKMHILRNNAQDALIPLGIQLVNALNALVPALTKIAQTVDIVGNAFSKLPSPIRDTAGIAVVAIGAIAGISFVASTLAAVVIRAAGAITGIATSLGLMGASADGAAVSVAAVGVAADAATVGVTALAVADGEMAAASTAATGATAGLLTNLARFASFGIIAVAIEVSVDAFQNAPSDHSAQFEKIADGIVSGVADAIRAVGGKQIADALDANVAEAAAGMQGRDVAIDLGFTLKQKTGNLDLAVQSFIQNGVPGGSLIPDNWIPDVQHADDEIVGLNITVGELQKQADAAGISFEDMLVRQADALGITTPAIEAYKKAQADATASTEDQTAAVADQANTLQDQVQAQIDSKKAQDELNQAVKATLNAQFLASAAAKGLALPFTRNADDAQKATEDFNKSLDDLTGTALNAERGLGDIAPTLAGMQAGFGKAGQSVTDMVRAMDDVGVLNLTPAVRQALDLVSALAKVDAKIADVEAAITNNEGDLSMWQGRIDLVTNTFGANGQQISDWTDQLQTGKITQEQFNAAIDSLAGSGGFPKLDALLSQGKITQQEYNDALKAGPHLLERSTGALQDEEAEIVRNIIALDHYVTAHDDADGAVKDLTDSQRGYIAAMADSKVKTFLETLQLLTYLAAAGQIPPEKVTQFIADSSQADPVIAAVAQDLDLLPDEHSTVITADAHQLRGQLEDVKGVILETTADGATITVNADTQEAAQKFLDLNRDQLDKLDGRELIVKVKGDDGKWQTTYDQVIGQTIPDKTVNVKANLDPFFTGEASAPDLGHVAESVKQPETGQPAPVVFTAEDKVTPVTEAIGASVSKLQTDVATAITSIAANVSDGIAQGFTNGENAARAGAIGILSALNVGQQSYNLGFNDGYDFSIGAANGILANWNAVFNAGFAIGQAADAGTRAGMQAHSPSRLAIKSGENWIAGVVQALRAGGSDVEREARDVFARMARVGSAPMQSPAMRALLTVDTRPHALLAASVDSERGRNRAAVTHLQLINNFHGITDTGEIVTHVSTEFNRALDRGAAAGLFESSR